MNTIHQISRNNSGGSDTDSADGNVLYKNLDKNKNDSSKDNDHHHYSNDDTVEDFVNPLFKENTPPDYNDKPSPLSASNSYDQLNFSNSKKPDGAKEERTLTNSSSNLSSQQFQPFTQRTDITKPPEEIEMGVGNFAFEDDRSRQNSWENSLSVFTPYAVNTPVSNPVNPLDTRMNSLTTHEKRVSSNCSDYSLASDENPYAAPSEKSPQYEDLAAMHAKLQEEHESKNAVLPARNGNQKKRNMLYEPAVITSKHKEVRRTTSLGAEPKEAYDVDERASYCHVIFTILVGIIALIAIVVVFLLVFGIISAKKCEECSISNAPSTGASTGASTDKGSGDSSDSNTQLQLELQYLRGNVSKLQRALDAVTKDNTKAKITILENEVQSQKFKVKALSSELAYQNNVTKTLNETSLMLASHLKITNMKLKELNKTSLSHHDTIQTRMLNTQIGIKQKMSGIRAQLQKVRNDLLVSNTTLRLELNDRISTRDFTKLINESQNVVNQLVAWINKTNDKQRKLDMKLQKVDAILNQTLTTLTSRPKGLTFTSCAFSEFKRTKSLPFKTYLLKPIPKKASVLSASCSGDSATKFLNKDQTDGRYFCDCDGTDRSGKYTCVLQVWYCLP